MTVYTNQRKRFIKELYRAVYKDVAPAMIEKLDQLVKAGINVNVAGAEIIVSQNVLRFVLECCITEASKTESDPDNFKVYLVELGARLAAYCVTGLPIEDQQKAIDGITEGLGRTVAAKIKDGSILHIDWVDEHGNFVPAIPTKNEVN